MLKRRVWPACQRFRWWTLTRSPKVGG